MAVGAALVLGGLKIGESIFDASSDRAAARSNIKSIDEQIALMNKQKDELAFAYGQRKEMITDQFGNKIDFLTESTGRELGNIGERFDVAKSGSGLAFSGTLESKERNR